MAFLRKLTLDWDKLENKKRYPFNIPSLSKLDELELNYNVTFFIGENGTGKSTLLEAIAFKCGFGNKGGGKNNIFDNPDESQRLESLMTLSWMPKVNNGFFLRAETFFDFADYIDEVAKEDPRVYNAYGGESLHKKSHGEAFLTLFTNRFGGKSKCLFILDEPEVALSPQRQLAFLRIIRQLEQTGNAQFLIATHSPIVMAYPDAVIYSFDGGNVQQIAYEQTEHYQLTKYFLNNTERFLTELFED